jgi:lipoate-protein ligase B
VLRQVRLYQPGLVDYHGAWRWQRETAACVASGAPEALAVLQHAPVYTLGRRARRDSFLVDAETLARRGAAIVETDRGGDVTFHGPGQLIAYPILDLRARGLAASDYVRLLEEVMLRTVGALGIGAVRSPGRPGIWAGDAKLGAVGVRIQRGVTTHGLALNVDPDLLWFDAIVPCGLKGVEVTSMARLLANPVEIAAVEDAFIASFELVFDSIATASQRASARGEAVPAQPLHREAAGFILQRSSAPTSESRRAG